MTAAENAEMRAVYREIYALMRAGDHAEIDRRLAGVDVASKPPVVLLAWLTITAAARRTLPARTAFYLAARDRITALYGAERAARLLKGLE